MIFQEENTNKPRLPVKHIARMLVSHVDLGSNYDG
jgi:hypothetical protein